MKCFSISGSCLSICRADYFIIPQVFYLVKTFFHFFMIFLSWRLVPVVSTFITITPTCIFVKFFLYFFIYLFLLLYIYDFLSLSFFYNKKPSLGRACVFSLLLARSLLLIPFFHSYLLFF